MQTVSLRSIFSALVALFAFTFLWNTAVAADAPRVMRASAQAFGHIPDISDMALSPNGKLLGWIDNTGPITGIAVLDVDSGKMKRTLAFEQAMKLRRVDWSDDETLLVTVSVTASLSRTDEYVHEWFRTIAVDVATGKTRVLLMHDYRRTFVTGSSILSLHSDKPHTVMMSTLDYAGGDGWVLQLYEVDTQTGKGKSIDASNAFTDEYVVDGEGHLVARAERSGTNEFRVFAWNGRWKSLEAPQGESMRLLGRMSDGRSLLILGENKDGHSQLWTLRLDGTGSESLALDADEAVEGGVLDPFTNAVVGVEIGGAEPRIKWLDSATEARSAKLEHAFAGKVLVERSRSQDAKRALVKVSTPSTPVIYYLVDFTKGTADIAGEEYPTLAQVPMGELKAITYKARDGQEIPAYLTLPPSAPKQPLPMIVLPHGGPGARDYPQFDWLTQFIATRGYVVLQPQFRGSTGFGEAFRLAGQRQWGRLMQDDLTDGVRAMIDEHIADPTRICIVGASYGGYAALAGAAFTNTLYRCAASISGVSDLSKMNRYNIKLHGENSDLVSAWREEVGAPLDPEMIARSPARFALNISANVLLIHGLDDTIVPFEQSKIMETALKNAGKQCRLVTLKAEDHWLSRSETRTQVLTELEQFLADSLK